MTMDNTPSTYLFLHQEYCVWKSVRCSIVSLLQLVSTQRRHRIKSCFKTHY